MKQLVTGSTPDITPVQALVAAMMALVQSSLVVANVFGASLSLEQQAAIVGEFTALGTVLVVADALIRRGRAKVEVSKYVSGLED